jgi:hypothetical protein
MNRRFALFQVLVSVIALGAVVWWALGQEAPRFPTHGEGVAWLLAGVGLYAIATLLRGERWHLLLGGAGVHARRADCYALTTVGYMGNNVLPARAGEMLRVVLLSARCDSTKRTLLGSVVAERLLDAIALGTIFLIVVYAFLTDAVPDLGSGAILAVGAGGLLVGAAAIYMLRRHHVVERVRAWMRPLADAPRSLLSRRGVMLLGLTVVLWTFEGSVYLAVARAVNLDVGGMGALYLVALTNFFAALPAAPGSLGTFDAAVAHGVTKLGATGAAPVTYLLVLRFILYIPITVVGFLMLVTRYGGWSRLRSATRLEASRA